MKPQLAEHAAARHGVFHVDDAIAAGHTIGQIRRFLRDGQWLRRAPDTFTAASTPYTVEARMEAAMRSMPCDFAFSHLVAAQMWNLRAPAPDTVSVVIDDRHRLRRKDLQIRRVRARMLRRRRFRDGLPVTDLETTILHCAAVLAYEDLVTLVEDALRRGLTTIARLRKRLGRGLSGAAALRGLLEEIDDGFHDRWTRRLVRGLVRAGVVKPEHAVVIRGRNGRMAKPDMLWRHLKLIGEVDDWETHGSRSAQEADRARDRWLRAEFGIETMRTTPREIRNNLDRVVADFKAVVDRLAAQFAA